jgi:hypothetical protein
MRFFLTSFFLGLILTGIGAKFYPFPASPRVYSQAEVLIDGNREETFFIRLPDDRIGSPRAASTAAFPQQAFSPVGKERILAELFRVRDTDGTIIGLATRMNGTVPGPTGQPEPVTDWMVVIPGRGALMMSRGSVATGAEREFYVDRMGFSFENSGPVISGTGGFAGLMGFYGEETEIENIDADGQAHGVVRLITRLRSNE